MKLNKIRGGNEKNLLDKKYNIGIGISLGNKWFTSENITEQIKWALSFTREYVVVYVADAIHAINLEVRNKIPSEKAQKSAKEKGTLILEEVKALVEASLTVDEITKIRYAHWNDLIDEEYIQKKQYLYSLYESSEEFKTNIHKIVTNYTSREDKAFSAEQIHSLGMYIVEELPFVIYRVPLEKLTFEAYTYPYDGDLPRLAEDIQRGVIFPEIKKAILNTEPRVFLEVR